MVYHPSSPWGEGKHTTDKTVGDIHQWNSKFTHDLLKSLFIPHLHIDNLKYGMAL